MSTASNNANNANLQQTLSQFESIMDALVRATSASSRSSAEQKLSEAKKSNLLLYLECLLQLTLKSQTTDIKQLSIVMFRQSLQPNNLNAEDWNKIPISAYNAFQNGLLTALNTECDIKTYLLICDAIGTLASRLIPKGYWQNLLSQLLELANKPNSFHKQGFLRVLDCLAEYSIQFLKPNFNNIYKVIQTAMNDQNITVILTAYKAFVSIVISLDNLDELKKWQDLIPQCLNLLNIKDEVTLREILASTIDIVCNRFMLIKPVLDQLLIPVVGIARNDNFEFETRKLAFEMMVGMTDRNASLLRGHSEYMKNVVSLSMYYLSLYDDSISFSCSENDCDQEYIWNARTWTNELAMKLGGKPFLNIAQSQIKQGLHSTNWKQCYSALQTFIQIIPHIREEKEWQIISPINDINHNNNDDNNNWDVLIPKIFSLSVSNSTRSEIKHSALFLIKTLINNYLNGFTSRYCSIFYNTMIKILCNYKKYNDRVLKECIKCISHFNNYLDINLFRDKSDVILKQLSLIILDCKLRESLRGHSITCIGTCADIMKLEFLPYYDKFMPIMMDIIPNNKLDQILRGKAMETIGMIGESVGSTRFNQDAHKLMSLLIPFRDKLKSEYESSEFSDNTAYNYINQLFARISRCIGSSFIQYFPSVIPSIIESSQIEAASMLKPDGITPIDARYSIFTVHIRGIGDVKFGINPISLEEKQAACHMLYQFVKDQCIGFFPYVISTANAMKSLMRYQYNPRVRTAATTIVPLLLKSIIKGINSKQYINNITNKEKQEYHSIFNQLFQPFMIALDAEPDVVETVPILEILGQIASVIGQSNGFWQFDDKQLLSIAEVLETLLSESQKRSSERIDDKLGNKLIIDEQKRNEIEWANDIENELIAHIIDCIEYVFKASGDKFTKYFDQCGIAKATKLMLEKDILYQTNNERLQAICIFIDCCQFGGKLAADKYINWFYPLLAKYCDDNDDDIKQTAIFGIGILAKCGYLKELDPNYKFLTRFLKQVDVFNNNEEKQENEDESDEISSYLIYENIVSSIGKIIRYQAPKSNILQILEKWILLLPIKNDEEEFNSITENLLFFINQFWKQLIINNVEIRQQILYCLLYYLSVFKDSLTSYELIMDYNIDMTDPFPSNIPILNKTNILKIKQLKENQFLIKIKAFEKIMEKLQPQQIQNIKYVINNY